MLGKPLHIGMGLEQSEALGERAVLPGREVLVTEEDDEVSMRRAADGLEGLVRQGSAEVEAVDLRTKCVGGRRDRKGCGGHCRVLATELAPLRGRTMVRTRLRC